MHRVVTLTTDFGTTEYVAAMKGVVLSINPQVTIVDISHDVRPQNILQGAYVLRATVSYFDNAIHVGVVDPGVGTERAGLIIRCEKGVLVGPDNGLLLPAARKLGLASVFRITNAKYLLDTISDTFHGRDIFAPAAAHLSRGVSPEEMGGSVDKYVDLKLEHYVEKDGRLEGRILHVDRFGNLISSIEKKVISEHLDFGSHVTIEMKGESEVKAKKIRFLSTYGAADVGELIATVSSSGFFEIACNRGSAGQMLNADLGDIIEVKIQ
ncbi:MAG: SAM-dependent chlorinase/fluorinase [Thermoplasmata archaeon]|nr:MAG: SAM-dependent chlorinase/fluorinase [Thermoplasmata archaeon]